MLKGMFARSRSSDPPSGTQELIDRDIKTKGEYYFADALNLMMESGAKFKTERADVWLDCGKPDAVLETNRYLLSHGQDNSGKQTATPPNRQSVHRKTPTSRATNWWVGRRVESNAIRGGSKRDGRVSWKRLL